MFRKNGSFRRREPIIFSSTEEFWNIVSVRLSLDPIDRNPFGHLMKFTQRSFPRYLLGFSTAFYRLELKNCLYWLGLSTV